MWPDSVSFFIVCNIFPQVVKELSSCMLDISERWTIRIPNGLCLHLAVHFTLQSTAKPPAKALQNGSRSKLSFRGIPATASTPKDFLQLTGGNWPEYRWIRNARVKGCAWATNKRCFCTRAQACTSRTALAHAQLADPENNLERWSAATKLTSYC
jgi:hypothetical protein